MALQTIVQLAGPSHTDDPTKTALGIAACRVPGGPACPGHPSEGLVGPAYSSLVSPPWAATPVGQQSVGTRRRKQRFLRRKAPAALPASQPPTGPTGTRANPAQEPLQGGRCPENHTYPWPPPPWGLRLQVAPGRRGLNRSGQLEKPVCSRVPCRDLSCWAGSLQSP